MLKFKEFLLQIENNTVGKHNDYAVSAILPSVSIGTQMPDFNGKLPYLSDQDMIVKGVPTVEKKGIITHIETKRDPCYIGLSDGTQLYIPWDAIRKRVIGWPVDNDAKGKTMRVVFQRKPGDDSEDNSKIAWATIS
jgi:hypothetical protein